MKISELAKQKISSILFKIRRFLTAKKDFFKAAVFVLAILEALIIISAILQPQPAQQPELTKLAAEEIFELRQQSQYQEVGAGITSSYFTYFLFPFDVAGEWVKLNIFTWRSEKKALQSMIFIQEKVEELEVLATGRSAASWHFNQTLRLHKYYEKKLQIALQKMQAKNDPQLLIEAGRINESLSRKADLLESKIQEISNEDKKTVLQKVAAQLAQSKTVASEVIQEDFFSQDSIERARVQEEELENIPGEEPLPTPPVDEILPPAENAVDGNSTEKNTTLENSSE